jgi:hypothetical protein
VVDGCGETHLFVIMKCIYPYFYVFLQENLLSDEAR